MQKSENDNKIKTINILTGKLDIKVQLNETNSKRITWNTAHWL
jgi:hypothetical protein